MSLTVYLTVHECPKCGVSLCDEPVVVYTDNITHNLGQMALEAGIYTELWHPDQRDITLADQLIAPLCVGLEKLEKNRDFFKTLNPKNGWGNYEGLVMFVRNLLDACQKNRLAKYVASP